jgi:hypothetical protein
VPRRELRHGNGRDADWCGACEADRKIGSLALLDVYGRARLLMVMAENVNGRRVSPSAAKQDIAKMIGASREW